MSPNDGDTDDGYSEQKAERQMAGDGAQGWQVAVKIIQQACRCRKMGKKGRDTSRAQRAAGQCYADHIPLLIDMNPQVPSRLSFLLKGEGKDPAPVLAAMAKRLETAGAQALVMPCNTAHYFLPEVQDVVGIPFLSMVDPACRKAAGIVGINGRVGILASPATDEIGLFKSAFEPYGIEAIYPSDQVAILAAIQAIKSSGPGKPEETILKRAAEDCLRQGAGALLVGCSELSLIAYAARGTTPVVDTLDIPVGRIVEFAGARPRAAI